MTGRAREVRALTGTHMVKWEYRSLLTKKKRFERCLGILVQHQIYTISNTNVNDQQIKKGRYGKGVFIEYKGEMPVLHFTPAYLSQASITRTTLALSKICAPWLLLFIGRSSRTAFGARGANFVLRGGRWSEIAKSEAKLNSTLFGHVVAGNMTQFVYQPFTASLRSSQHFSYCYCTVM